jgi:hypothetical protein
VEVRLWGSLYVAIFEVNWQVVVHSHGIDLVLENLKPHETVVLRT